MMNETTPRLALDMYVLAQGVKTGVYRVCDELFPRLTRSPRFDPRFLFREGDVVKAAPYMAEHRLRGRPHKDSALPSSDAEILLSPFGVAPQLWLDDKEVLLAHIVYDLIAIHRPDFFSLEGSTEVRNIIASLDEHTVIFAISEHTKKDLLAYRPDLSPAQITVIPLGAGHWFYPCDSAAKKVAMRAKYAIPADVPYILSLATLEIRKNLDQVVNAFVRFLEQNETSDMHLVLSGMSGWKLEKLNAALVAASKWRHRIVLTGFVDDADLSALYSDAMCFIYMSRYEGFGLPPLEAMACGTPVICASNSSLPEVVADAGLLLDADDVDGVMHAIRDIAASDSYRSRLALAGMKRARLFSWDRCAEIVIDTLSDAYARHVQRPLHLRRPSRVAGVSQDFASGASAEAVNFSGYRNGAMGPAFRGRDLLVASPRERAWPRWTDRLPCPAGASRTEGGLRTLGLCKTGTPERPLVTYITVVRNNTATLARTIESVQQQTYDNIEHVVLDGASTDGTLDLILQYGDRLDYFVSEPDAGLYDAINKAIPLARGQLICILNSDDWLEPQAAEIAVHRLKKSENPSLLLTTALVRNGDLIQEWHPALVHPGCYLTCADDCHNAIYATRTAYEASGPYDTSFRIAADFKWIMTCLDRGMTFIYTKEATVNYSLGGTSGDVRQHSIECMRVVRDRFEFLSSVEVSGLYHAFFLLAGPFAAEEPHRQSNQTLFLRSVFAKHAGHPDFSSTLAWASMATLDHPAEAQEQVSVPLASTNLRSRKEMLKGVLHRYPRLYGLVRRGYLLLRG